MTSTIDHRNFGFVCNINKIEELVKSHDVIYASTDSKESHWLPILLSKIHNKIIIIIIIITTAIGYDTFLVFRNGNNLGCYFCSDVIGPIDTISLRSLDEQCTVSRPGLTMIAPRYAVEMMVDILQKKDQYHVKLEDLWINMK